MSKTPARTKGFPLMFPFDYKGEEITSLTLRRPKVLEVKEMMKSNEQSFTASADFIADLAGKPHDLMDGVDAEDYADMQAWVAPIMGKLAPK